MRLLIFFLILPGHLRAENYDTLAYPAGIAAASDGERVLLVQAESARIGGLAGKIAPTVETNFPGGNACAVSTVDGEVRFSANPRGGTECLWFYLRVHSGGSAPRLRLVLENAGNILGGCPPGETFRPVIRTADSDWERLPAGKLATAEDGRVAMAWEVPAPRAWLEIAYCYPYGRAELNALVRDTGAYWRRDVVGITQGGRPLERLSNAASGQRPGLYLVARQHSGETPGSWVLDGALREFARTKSKLVVWVVPFADLDGVELGAYGKDAFPYDMNRAWGRPPMRHETLVLQRDMERWAERCRPLLALDFHAPSSRDTAGVYFFLADETKEPERAAAAQPWIEQFAGVLRPEYSAEKYARVAHHMAESRWTTPSFAHYVWEKFKFPGITMETPYTLAGSRLLTRDDYRAIGRRMAEAISERAKQ